MRKRGGKPVFEILDIVPEKEWRFWEQYWIGQFRIWGFDLINQTDGGDGTSGGNQTSFKLGTTPWNKGLPRSEETKLKIRVALTGRPSLKKRRIKQFTEDMILIREFASITEAQEATGIKNINKAINAFRRNGSHRLAGGYVWL